MSATTKLSTVFASGALGGLAYAVTSWFFGHMHITHSLGVAISPTLTPGYLYSKIVWGGIWGLLFLLPILKTRVIARGLLFSLFPSLVLLVYIFPYKTSAGMFGLGLGQLTPLFILIFSAVGGIVASFWARTAK